MIRCTAISLFCCLLGSFLGCSSLRNDDALSAYSLPGEVEADEGVLSDFSKGVAASAKSAMGLGPNEAAARELFADAMAAYRDASGKGEGPERSRAFDKAAKLFDRAAARWPKSSIEEDAMFYQAECFFFANRYPKAEEQFGQIVAKHINTKHIDRISERRFQIAKYWLNHHGQRPEHSLLPNFTSRERPTFDKFGNAIKILERIRLDDPTGELADDATMLAAQACFEDERFFRADELLTDLRRSFPSSQHQYPAHMMGLKCKTQLYQGPNYASGPLDEAEDIIRQMRRQFPSESSQDTEFLARAFKDVRMNRAIREMNLARYRDRRQEYRAARKHYERVAMEFTDTSLADEARERVAQLGGRPDLPPQRLEWLAKAFPSTSDAQPLIATKPDASRR